MRKVKLLLMILLMACLLSGLAACGAGNPVTADNAGIGGQPVVLDQWIKHVDRCG